MQIAATSPLLGRGVVIGRRVAPDRCTISTFVFYAQPVASRAVWTVVSPLHRTVARYLLRRGAQGAPASDGR